MGTREQHQEEKKNFITTKTNEIWILPSSLLSILWQMGSNDTFFYSRKPGGFTLALFLFSYKKEMLWTT
jgi:hypothetical protein